ncbi:TetR/AcrR family transcriptional regulator [Pelagibacterium halotolerans]|uniref:TetR/AcrR family transcriptional regulator n=1 Tax=Pelagibacterium halotolerans TaxID=531813 RepID=UPI003850CB2B
MSARKGKSEREAVLLDTAATLFLENGFDATTLAMVISRTGGSRRDIYALFGDKEAMFVRAMRRLFDRMLAPLGSLADVDAPPEIVLPALGKRFVAIITAPEMLLSYRLILAETGRFPELGTAFYELGPGRAYPSVAAYLRRETERGRLRMDDPERAAIAFLEMVKGNLQQRIMFFPGARPDAGEIDAHVAVAVRIFLEGVSPR